MKLVASGKDQAIFRGNNAGIQGIRVTVGFCGRSGKALLRTALPASVRRMIVRLRSESPVTYDQDGLLTVHNCDFMLDSKFNRAYQAGKATGSWGAAEIHWRAYVACWAAARGAALEGDFVECGVNKGGLARAIVDYVNFVTLPKTFYLLDTFAGLAAAHSTPDELDRTAGIYEESYEEVVATFRSFPNVAIIRGPVPDTLPKVTAARVSYLSIDMNSAVPERAALEFFWDKLVSGAIALLDDYGWKGYEKQKISADEFAANNGVQVLALPTGQGLLIKP